MISLALWGQGTVANTITTRRLSIIAQRLQSRSNRWPTKMALLELIFPPFFTHKRKQPQGRLMMTLIKFNSTPEVV
jgi:hypothetical protein